MRKDIVIDASVADRARLEAVMANRNSPQKHVWRATIILLTADGLGTVEIMRRTGKSKTCLWRWQVRFMAAGVDGLLRDNDNPKPFTWTADPDQIIAAVRRGHQVLDSMH